MIWLVPCVDLIVMAMAFATIAILRDVASLVRSAELKRAWRTLSMMLGCCIVLLAIHATYNLGLRPGTRDLVGVAIFQIGVSFIIGTAWLARRTAREMLNVQDVADSAYRDTLTGLGNRRRFDDALGLAVAESRATGRNLSLLAIDIDRFKEVNDTHGHAAGDEVLRHVASTIRANVDAANAVCRIGGEEFTVILDDLDTAAAALLAEQLRASVASNGVPLGVGVEARVTISLGCATFSGWEAGEELVRRADAALYSAKADGRDGVRLAAGPLHRHLPRTAEPMHRAATA